MMESFVSYKRDWIIVCNWFSSFLLYYTSLFLMAKGIVLQIEKSRGFLVADEERKVKFQALGVWRLRNWQLVEEN